MMGACVTIARANVRIPRMRTTQRVNVLDARNAVTKRELAVAVGVVVAFTRGAFHFLTSKYVGTSTSMLMIVAFA